MRSFIFALALALCLPAFSVNGREDDKKGSPKSPHQTRHVPQAGSTLTKDGAANPNSIPEIVAYTFFLNSLLAKPEEGELGRNRVRAFARKAGLNEIEVDALLHNALQFKAATAPFDQQIMDIKDKTWPNPPKQVWDQLRALQVQKEAAINSFITSLLNRLGREAAPKVSAHLLRVKTRVKGYADAPVIPGQRSKTAFYQTPTPGKGRLNALLGVIPSHSLLGRNGMTAATIAQMGDGTVYLYLDIGTDSNGAYGYGSVSSSGDSYGHTYTVRTEVNGPTSCQYSVGVNSAFVSLVGCNGFEYDGFYSSTAIAEQYCPIANSTNDVGSSNSSEMVAPFVALRLASLPNGISTGNTPNLTYEVTGSFSILNLTGTLDVSGVGAVNITPGSIPNLQVPYKVGDGVKTHPLGAINLVATENSGQMAAQVSFTNCVPPSGAPQGTTFQGGCVKETNVMTVTR